MSPSESFQSASKVFMSLPHTIRYSVMLQLHTQTSTFLFAFYTSLQHQHDHQQAHYYLQEVTPHHQKSASALQPLMLG
jgi:hypothetical protein